jgi:hypothetical protein
MPYTGTGPGQPPAAPQPPGNYVTGVQSLLNSANPSSQAAGVAAAGQAPGIAQSGLTMQQLLSEIGLTVPSTQEQLASSALNTTYGLEQAGIGQNQNQISQAQLANQAAGLSTQQGFTTAEYNLNQQQYPEQLAEAALQNKQATLQLNAQQATTGTSLTQGGKLAQSAQKQQYGWQQQDINRAQQLAGLQQQAGLAGTQTSMSDIALSQQNLEQAAAANGISVKQMLAQYQQGAQQLGQNANQSLDQLYTQYLSQQGSQVQGLGTAAGEIGLLDPGAMASAGQAGGLNLNQLFAGGAP